MSLPGDTLQIYPFLVSTNAHIRHKLLCAAADMDGALSKCPVLPQGQGAEAQSARAAEIQPRPPSPPTMIQQTAWALLMAGCRLGSPGRGGARPRRSLPPGPLPVLSAPASLGRTHPMRASLSPEAGGEQHLAPPPACLVVSPPRVSMAQYGTMGSHSLWSGRSSGSRTGTEAPALSPRALVTPPWGLDPRLTHL